MQTQSRPTMNRISHTAEAPPEISVVIPVAERPEPLDALYEEFTTPLRSAGRRYEVVVVTPAYFHDTVAAARSLAARGEPVRLIEVGRVIGETGLLRLGLTAARGEIVLTLPAYRQVEAASLLPLIERVEAGSDFAVARRWPRRDALVNRVQNRVLHAAIGGLAGGRVHDVACGVRAARRAVLGEIPLYGDFARFLPLLALQHGYTVEEVASAQHASDMRGRIYGPGTYLRRLIDVFGLFFLMRFTDKPLRFFGLVGSGLAAAGVAVLLVLFVERLGGQGIADRPLLLLGVLLAVLGVQAIALGLIGEMIVHFSSSGRRIYRLRGERDGRRG